MGLKILEEVEELGEVIDFGTFEKEEFLVIKWEKFKKLKDSLKSET